MRPALVIRAGLHTIYIGDASMELIVSLIVTMYTGPVPLQRVNPIISVYSAYDTNNGEPPNRGDGGK